MRIGIFADSHDHLTNIRRAVDEFNRLACDQVLFAGDLVSTIALPPLRKLTCPLAGCYGDNEGNKLGLQAGLGRIGTIREPPFVFAAEDGTRFGVAHMQRQLEELEQPFDVAVYAHTHKPRVFREASGRLCINPGETGGWSFGRPTVVVLETETMEACVVELPSPSAAREEP